MELTLRNKGLVVVAATCAGNGGRKKFIKWRLLGWEGNKQKKNNMLPLLPLMYGEQMGSEEKNMV